MHHKIGKGEYDRYCNREDCQSPKMVYYYNRGTYKYYCKVCAMLLNKVNNDNTLCSYNTPQLTVLTLVKGSVPRDLFDERADRRRIR